MKKNLSYTLMTHISYFQRYCHPLDLLLPTTVRTAYWKEHKAWNSNLDYTTGSGSMTSGKVFHLT